MADIERDPLTGDIDLSSGLRWTKTLEDEAVQRINLWFTINVGEFFSHINHGLPWVRTKESGEDRIRYFLEDNFPNPEIYIAKTLDMNIRKLPFISRLISSDYDFDRQSRTFKYYYTAELTDGSVIDFPPYTASL